LTARLQETLIVGGGVTGMTAALDLAAIGRPARLVEKRKTLGGYAANYCCKATDRCQQCGACLVDEMARKVEEEPLITLALSTEVTDIERDEQGFSAELASGDRRERTGFPAVLLSAGFIPFNPRQKPHLGYGRIANMITGADLEKMLRDTGSVVRPSDRRPPERMAFVQCVGSRDAALGNVYCSRVCCAYALRIARLLKRENPGLDITFFYMDVQTFGKSFAAIWPDVGEEIRMIREMPGEYYRLEGDRIGVVVPYPDGAREETFDLLALSVGMTPGADHKKWSEKLGFDLNDDGFLAPGGSAGAVAAGSATGPLGIKECIEDAHRAARRLTLFLEGAS